MPRRAAGCSAGRFIVALAGPAVLAADSGAVIEALGWTADTAGYWGEPGLADQALAADAAVAALRPIAVALAASPATRWWDSPADLARQRYAQYLDQHPLSVVGYLTTAGVAVPVPACLPEACTLMAGWDPDATWWLTDVLSADGPPEDWAADDAAFGWHPVG